MKQLLKSYLIKTLALANVFPVRKTPTEDICTLMKKLYPKSTEKELIRFGPRGDGGYLIPDDLLNISSCFSPGVSSESGFENDCADRGMKIFLADKSVDGPAVKHKLFKFTKKFIGAITNEEFITLDDWVTTSLSMPVSDLLLQMDIEGYEYEVFLSTSAALMQRFRIIVAEFHHLDQLWNAPFFSLASRAFEKILQTHSCVHIHPNNCCGSIKRSGMEIPSVMEFTFQRNDRVNSTSYQMVFPHPLDFDCTKRKSLTLPNCWYQNHK